MKIGTYLTDYVCIYRFHMTLNYTKRTSANRNSTRMRFSQLEVQENADCMSTELQNCMELDPCPQTGVNQTFIGRTKLGKTPNSKREQIGLAKLKFKGKLGHSL